jgi:transposase
VTHAAEQEREDVQALRISWREKAPDWDPQRLVFLDETGLNTKMAPLYGRAPRAERCVQKVPHGHWQACTFIAALRHDRVTAPWLLDGPMDRVAFLTYLEQCLAPTLHPGDVVIADNLSSHKGPAVTAAVERCGAQLIYLPPYSPDFNPIELAFAKLKAHLRPAAARTFDALVGKLNAALDTFLPRHCANFFAHCHYAST